MHEYSIDVERNKVFFYIAAISIIISGSVSYVINLVILTIPYIEFTISIASMAVFGTLYSVFDKVIWKLEFLKKIGIVQTPNLNGTWEGEFSSSYYNFEKSFPAKFVIEQTWSKICIMGEFNYSTSSSYTASLKVNEGGGVKLFYSYYNDKSPEFYKESMSNHRGYGSLEIDNSSIVGYYFNDPTNNKNHGRINLKRCS